MSVSRLEKVLRIFGGGTMSAEEKQTLAKEALLMTLARVTNADSNIATVEVETVRKIYAETTGEEITPADVRTAARSDLYESTPLTRYLSGIQSKIDLDDKVRIAGALAEVIKSDRRISPAEIDFFNQIAAALALTPADLVGMRAAS